MKLLFYKSESKSPYKNLAVEKYLFDNLGQDFFVFYLWQNQNTVVIGRNQNAFFECKIKELQENGGHLARRMSGGGAVYHDLGNLNFTYIFNNKDYNLSKNFYVIAKALKNFGITAKVSGRNDITAEGKKFSGNAFMKTKEKTCHHGTLLVDVDIKNMTKFLKVNKKKLLKNGVKSVSSRVTNLKALNESLTIPQLEEALYNSVIDEFKPSEIVFADIKNIDDIVNRFSSEDFLYGSNASFVSKASGQFDWGKIDIDFTIQSDKIKYVDICTDCLNLDIIEDVKIKLTNLKIIDLPKLCVDNKIGQDIIKLLERNI